VSHVLIFSVKSQWRLDESGRLKCRAKPGLPNRGKRTGLKTGPY
jgi:hypothetical protein